MVYQPVMLPRRLPGQKPTLRGARRTSGKLVRVVIRTRGGGGCDGSAKIIARQHDNDYHISPDVGYLLRLIIIYSIILIS